jgi:hypothetical protein
MSGGQGFGYVPVHPRDYLRRHRSDQKLCYAAVYADVRTCRVVLTERGNGGKSSEGTGTLDPRRQLEVPHVSCMLVAAADDMRGAF